jgi:glyoxylase-like metal-dependent hydrolase (beta-lactamase superfamily II)
MMTTAPPRAAVRLEVLLTAEVPMPHAYVFRASGNRLVRLGAGLNPRANTLHAPCLAYVIRHPHQGVILIDTGFHPDALNAPRTDFGLAIGLLFRGLVPAATAFDEQLRKRGIEPEEVERVVMTHLHADHTSGMRLLPNARFICTKEEWRAAQAKLGSTRGYVGHHLPPESRVEPIDFGRAGEQFGPFAKTIDLLGDGSVRLISSPGHTPGHQSVLLELENGNRVLVVGDAAYTLRSIHEQILPMLTADDDASRRSLRELKAFADDEPEVILVPTHDPDAWRQLERLPQG